MRKLPNGTWKERHIPKTRRPTALPGIWGAGPLSDDIAERWDPNWSRPKSEPLHFLALTAFQYMMVSGPPWNCFYRDELKSWPAYHGEKPPGTIPLWRAFEVYDYADFLAHYEGGLPQDRVSQVLSQMDLFADYMVAAGAIDDTLRERWVAGAQTVIDVFADQELGCEPTSRGCGRRRRQ